MRLALLGLLAGGGAGLLVRILASAEAASGSTFLGTPRLLLPTILTFVLLALGGWGLGQFSRFFRDGMPLTRAAGTLLLSVGMLLGSGPWALHVVLIPAVLFIPFGILMTKRSAPSKA